MNDQAVKPSAEGESALDRALCSLPNVEDLAHEITQDCLSFGLSTDTVARYLRSYDKKVRAAITTCSETECAGQAPIDMVLHCPRCGDQHIDAPEGGQGEEGAWDNPPHRSHVCQSCGHVWRPADVPTNGVLQIKTQGTNDSPLDWNPPEWGASGSPASNDEIRRLAAVTVRECPPDQVFVSDWMEVAMKVCRGIVG